MYARMIGTGGENTRILVVEDDGIIAFDMVSALKNSVRGCFDCSDEG